jgi:acyl-CoA synthetase (NDP forming)
MSGHNLKFLLAPESLAVVGGSDRAGRVEELWLDLRG